MKQELAPGGTYHAARDIVVDGKIAFVKGEAFALQDTAPDSQRPGFKYRAFSVRLASYARLRKEDLALKQCSWCGRLMDRDAEVCPCGRRQAVHKLTVQQAPGESCAHDLRPTDDPRMLACTRCGHAFTLVGELLPDVPAKCPSCGEPLSFYTLECERCGALVQGAVERKAILDRQQGALKVRSEKERESMMKWAPVIDAAVDVTSRLIDAAYDIANSGSLGPDDPTNP